MLPQSEESGQGERSDDADSDAAAHRVSARLAHVMSVGNERAAKTFARYRHRPMVDLGVRIRERDRASAGSLVGSAIAMRLFLFFIPFLLFLVGIAGFLRGAIGQNAAAANGISGRLAGQINDALAQHGGTRWIAALTGLFGMVTAGRTVSKTVASASCLAWQLPLRVKASIKATGAVIGLMVAIGLAGVLVNRLRAEAGLAVGGVSFAVAAGVYVVCWMLVTASLPRATSDPGALLPGAVLLAVVLAGMQAISQLYLPHQFSRASELYGAIGVTIVVLGWFFILGRAIVLALVIDAVIYEKWGSISEVVFALPGVRALPKRSKRIRTYFGLDRDAGGGPADPD